MRNWTNLKKQAQYMKPMDDGHEDDARSNELWVDLGVKE